MAEIYGLNDPMPESLEDAPADEPGPAADAEDPTLADPDDEPGEDPEEAEE